MSEAVETAAAVLLSDPAAAAAAEVLSKVLGNVLSAPQESKFRRLRLGNRKIHDAVVEVRGGLELLQVGLLCCSYATSPKQTWAGS